MVRDFYRSDAIPVIQPTVKALAGYSSDTQINLPIRDHS